MTKIENQLWSGLAAVLFKRVDGLFAGEAKMNRTELGDALIKWAADEGNIWDRVLVRCVFCDAFWTGEPDDKHDEDCFHRLAKAIIEKEAG